MRNLLKCLVAFFLVTACSTYLCAQTFDLQLSKSTVAAGITNYGVAVTFNIIVENTGTDPVQNVAIVDYVPTGYEYLPADNPNWSFDAVERKATRMLVGTINPGNFQLTSIVLRPQPVDDISDWVNAAEITAAQDQLGNDISDLDADSNYDDIQGNGDALEDDYDEASVFVYDLALRKTLQSPTSAYSYGG